ncbi:MAG: peptidylprolyl isomerase [Kofleriaceae bacterium]
MRIYRSGFLLVFLLAAVACKQNKSKLDDNSPPKIALGSAADGVIDIDSKEILGRALDGGGGEVEVKHVLIGWKELDATTYHGRIDPRAKKRTNAEAAKLATDIAQKLRDHPDQLDAIVKESSEDPGGVTGEPYTVDKDTPFVPEFKNLALRLKPNEVGIVKTAFGYHVMMRVPPPPPDPLESKDILDRPAEAGPVTVQHVLIGWKDTPMAKQRQPDPRAKDRTKEQADKLATEILAKAKAPDADFAKLMKEYSEDPGSKDTGKAYDVAADSQMVEPFKKLSLRLKEGEVGLVKSPFGWHIIKRVPPPPPDPLESKDILARTETAPKVKVKHILLGWTEVHGQDPRGTKRTRAELDKLVHDTVEKLNKGAKIEDLMKALSEDPGSAKSGSGYDVTPDTKFVAPFKNLALRLKLNEVGVVKSDFGIHIIKRVE